MRDADQKLPEHGLPGPSPVEPRTSRELVGFHALAADPRHIHRPLADESEQIRFVRGCLDVHAVERFLDIRQIDTEAPLDSQQPVAGREFEWRRVLGRHRQRHAEDTRAEHDRTHAHDPASQRHDHTLLQT